MSDPLLLEDGSTLLGEDSSDVLLETTYGTVAAASSQELTSPSRSEEYFFELVDDDLDPVGAIHPETGATITCRSGQPVGRTIGDLVIPPDELNDLNPAVDRVRAWTVVNGDPYSLGVYAVTVDTEHESDRGSPRECQLADLGSLLTGLDGTLDNAFGVRAGTPIRVPIVSLLEQFGIYNHNVIDTGLTAGNHLAWAPTNNARTVLSSLCKIVGLTSPWLDLNGVAQVGFLPYVGVEPAWVFDWGTRGSITSDGIQRVTDRFAKPTKWRVMSKTTTGADVGGVFVLPDSHPQSRASRGLLNERVVHVELPGLTTSAQCAERARDLAQREVQVSTTEQWSGAKIPTLELNDVVTVAGNDRLLDTWTYPMEPGADSDYTARDSLTRSAE